MIGSSLTGWPVSFAITASAATFAWLFAMKPDFGIAGAGAMASPMTCTPGIFDDSKPRYSTPHHWRLTVIRSVATIPARCGGMMLNRSAFTSSTCIRAMLRFRSNSTSSLFGRYSTMPL